MSKQKVHTSANEWLDGVFKDEYCVFDDKTGALKSVTLYYDAELEYNHKFEGPQALGASFPTCWYLLPQKPMMAFHLYMAATDMLQTRNPEAPFPAAMLTSPSGYSLMYLLAKEFGDDATVKKVEQMVIKVSEGKWFGAEGEMFGYFFFLDEKWPRGQISSLLMNGTVLTEGSWQRAFANSNDRSRFTAPTVEGINYPKCGVSKAFNDDDSNLHVSIYAATPSAKGEETSFHITNIDDAQRKNIEITCNGSKFENYEMDNAGVIKINTVIDEMSFIIKNTGYTKPKGKRFVPVTMKSQNVGKM